MFLNGSKYLFYISIEKYITLHTAAYIQVAVSLPLFANISQNQVGNKLNQTRLVVTSTTILWGRRVVESCLVPPSLALYFASRGT